MLDFVPNFTRILSIDGGGLRGLIPARVLVALERKALDFMFQQAVITDAYRLITPA